MTADIKLTVPLETALDEQAINRSYRNVILVNTCLFVAGIWIFCAGIALAAGDTDSVRVRNSIVTYTCCVKYTYRRGPNGRPVDECVTDGTCYMSMGQWQASDGRWHECRNIVDLASRTFSSDNVTVGWHESVTNDCWETRQLYGDVALIVAACLTLLVLLIAYVLIRVFKLVA